MARLNAIPGTDLASTADDLITLLERSRATLSTVGHALEQEFAERFGDSGVRRAARTQHRAALLAPRIPRANYSRLNAQSQSNPLSISKRIRRLEK